MSLVIDFVDNTVIFDKQALDLNHAEIEAEIKKVSARYRLLGNDVNPYDIKFEIQLSKSTNIKISNLTYNRGYIDIVDDTVIEFPKCVPNLTVYISRHVNKVSVDFEAHFDCRCLDCTPGKLKPVGIRHVDMYESWGYRGIQNTGLKVYVRNCGRNFVRVHNTDICQLNFNLAGKEGMFNDLNLWVKNSEDRIITIDECDDTMVYWDNNSDYLDLNKSQSDRLKAIARRLGMKFDEPIGDIKAIEYDFLWAGGKFYVEDVENEDSTRIYTELAIGNIVTDKELANLLYEIQGDVTGLTRWLEDKA